MGQQETWVKANPEIVFVEKEHETAITRAALCPGWCPLALDLTELNLLHKTGRPKRWLSFCCTWR